MGNACRLCDGKKSSDQQTFILTVQLLSLGISTKTWKRDSHGLFDYECQQIMEDNWKLSKSLGLIVRNEKGINLLKDKEVISIQKQNDDQEYEELVKIVLNSSVHWIFPTRLQQLELDDWNEQPINNEETSWIVLRDKESQSCKIYNVNDIIKLGRVRLRIKAFSGQKSSDINEKGDWNVADFLPNCDSSFEEQYQASESNLESISCRICYTNENEPSNPLFSACKCSGCIKYIHIECLQKWLQSRLETKEQGNSVKLTWKSLECEICKEQYPRKFSSFFPFLITLDRFFINGKQFEAIKLPKYKGAYLIIDILDRDTYKVTGCYILDMSNQQEFKLGRGHGSDVRLQDISVSRNHAKIILENGKFYLEDLGSKFGSLLLMKKPIPLCGVYSDISIQVGRTQITFAGKANIKPEDCIEPNTKQVREYIQQNTEERDISFQDDHELEINLNQSRNQQQNIILVSQDLS